MNFYRELSLEQITRAKKVKLLIMDVDGVLTDGRIFLSATGEEIKSFHTMDGLGIKLLQKIGIQSAIITGRDAPSVKLRAIQLGIEHYFAGIDDKATCFKDLLASCQITAEECAYIGDDIVDLPVMTQVGFAACPPNSHPLVIAKSNYTTGFPAGLGAVRELCDLILFAQNHYHSLMKDYLA